MIEKSDREEVSYTILKLMMKYIELESRVRNYGTDTAIFHSEIHIISIIANCPGIHIKGLAEKMGMTSASVSEVVTKLGKKGLIRKEISPKNKSRLSIFVTTKGQLAHEEHQRYHTILKEITAEVLKSASEEQVKQINDFLCELTEKLNTFEERT